MAAESIPLVDVFLFCLFKLFVDFLFENCDQNDCTRLL